MPKGLNIDNHLRDLFELLAIPTISAQSEHDADMLRGANWLKEKLVKLGFNSKVLPTKGHPIVYGDLMTDGKKPTVLIYGHYDVQAPDPLNEWSSEPFKPEVRGGNIYGRGVADDKGQIYTWIAAVEEIIEKGQTLKANLKFFIEGEEEVGSQNLTDFILDNKPLLQADICVISDSHCLSPDQPLIEYGLRGLAYAEITVRAFPKDLHSGLYGGNVLNPAQVLSELLTKMKDSEGRVLIPGFYENVRKLDEKELNQLSKFPFEEKQILEETSALVVTGEPEFSTQVRAGARPTFEINGIWGGYMGEGPKTIIPGEAHAKVSMRLVPFQTATEIYEKFEKHVKKLTPKGVEVTIHSVSTSEPVVVDTQSHFFKKAEMAYKKTFGVEPLYGLSGGTIGIVADLKNIMGIDSILMGYGLPDDGLHSPNEKFSLGMFEKGIKTNIEFLTSI